MIFGKAKSEVPCIGFTVHFGKEWRVHLRLWKQTFYVEKRTK
jgi:hypothetical protein